MFVRTENFREFIRFYPIVSFLVGLHFALWLLMDFVQLGIFVELKQWGTGMNVLILNGEYWRLVTPIFLHGDFAHALFNSFSLVLFGPALEQMLGKIKFIWMYIFAGIVGNLGTFVVDPDAYYWHLGASGAIFGIFGVYLFMVMNRKQLIDTANSQIILAIFAIGLFMTFARPNINIYGHLFGLIGGFAIAPVILRNARPFSLWQIRTRHSRPDREDISFDPNRWKNRPYSKKKTGKYILWGIIIFLALFALANRM
ncbi:Membrane associated serine protease, rhomboid family [Halobacillus karajensis]|uniref:Rhomboid protease GluP n=1 Tax=Halobacillus karajensis TaxID=195088 RepID=A0A024PAI8_9BACI|nr:rhomboid family intramembrane serine protease [Halobacillus karajensis]CDQ21507.1 Rhomboid protease GluP [Halobacillus karajensis]CDQ25442.1 Rhomboid protease GluP [Halobacillus karajensis]CDQ29027.1 Rhomboid protease GluP [Halobacillus karajensis]SEI09393.1 Membrane associated serine protease, rhomboid family [Halobacillus karajensis]